MKNREQYIRWLIESTPPRVKGWLGEEAVRRLMTADFEETWRTRTDPVLAASYREHCPIPGAHVSDYCLREVRLAPDISVLAGIHFSGLDVTRPFVGVYAQTRQLAPAEIQQASLALCEEFRDFAPASSWWWLEGGGNAPVPEEAQADQRVVIGEIATLPTAPPLPADCPFTLEPDRDGRSYDAYVEIFERFLQENPEWRSQGRLPLTARDDYLECADARALYVVESDGQVAGMIAARIGEVRGIPGWVIAEEILDGGLRGRGLAPHVQRLFIDRLDRGAARLVMGTIDAGNVPSLRTALRVGRTDVGGWYFVPGSRPGRSR